MIGGNAAVDDRHADAAAVHRTERLDRAGPRRLRAGHRGGHRHVRADQRVARHRARPRRPAASASSCCFDALNTAPDDRNFLIRSAVTLRQPIDRFHRAGDDDVDVDASDAGIEVGDEVRRQPRAPRTGLRRCGDDERAARRPR